MTSLIWSHYAPIRSEDTIPILGIELEAIRSGSTQQRGCGNGRLFSGGEACFIRLVIDASLYLESHGRQGCDKCWTTYGADVIVRGQDYAIMMAISTSDHLGGLARQSMLHVNLLTGPDSYGTACYRKPVYDSR